MIDKIMDAMFCYLTEAERHDDEAWFASGYGSGAIIINIRTLAAIAVRELVKDQENEQQKILSILGSRINKIENCLKDTVPGYIMGWTKDEQWK